MERAVIAPDFNPYASHHTVSSLSQIIDGLEDGALVGTSDLVIGKIASAIDVAGYRNRGKQAEQDARELFQRFVRKISHKVGEATNEEAETVGAGA